MSSDDGSSASGSDLDDPLTNAHPGEGFIRHTSFDAYFLQASRTSKTSNNVFSDVYPPLSREEYSSAISSVREKHQTLIDIETFKPWFKRYLLELEEGFNLLFYGFGSKREVLNTFARDHCSKRGHVVIVNAYRPDFALKDIFASIERIPGLADEPLATSSVEGQTQRICQFFASTSPNRPAPLFLIIHNIDSAPLRTSKATACLTALASCPRIHLAASIDHVNAPLLFPLSTSLGRKSDGPNGGSGYSWLWHDLTTLAPYDTELAFADPSSISGASGISKHAAEAAFGTDGAAVGGVAMTETAAEHILASVTQRARKLFILVARRQLDLITESSGDAASSSTNANRDLVKFGIAYDNLFVLARDGFIATSDAALRSLLGEFRDHGLIVSSTGANEEGGGGGKEMLYVPMRKERLEKVVAKCEQLG